jgi:hypothetical protein
MLRPVSQPHEEAIIVVEHSDGVALDVDWRHEPEELGVLDDSLPNCRTSAVDC